MITCYTFVKQIIELCNSLMQPKRELAIVLIDDNQEELEALCTGIQSIYEESGINVETYSSPEEAINGVSYLVAHQCQIPLVIADHAMPQIDGLTLIQTLRKTIPNPQPKYVIISDNTDIPALVDALGEHLIQACIAKPWKVKKLHKQLKSLTSDWIINNALDQTAYYQKLVSHNAYSTAVRSLSRQLGSLKQNFLDSGSVSDGDLVDSLVHELQQVARTSDDSLISIRHFDRQQILAFENAPANRELWIILEGQVKT